MTSIHSAQYQAYRFRRESHWDGLAQKTFNRTGINSGYHARIHELYRNSIPKGQSVLEIGCGNGDLLAALDPSRGVGVDFSDRMICNARTLHPSLEFFRADAQTAASLTGVFDYIIFSDLIDDLWDVQAFFEQIGRLCRPSTRIVFNFYSHLWSLPLYFAQKSGFATPMLPQNWLTVEDVQGLLLLSGFEVVTHRPEILLPLNIPVLAPFCNRFLAKIPPFSFLDITHMVVARYIQPALIDTVLPRVSVIVPARNEAGNIARLLNEVPQMGGGTEIVFVEGGSSDGTFEVIEAEMSLHPELSCSLFRQTGSGKGDAVRLGFERANGDILMILDADLTVAPDELPKFYQALVSGRGEFVNGVRLVYPMHEKAMRFINLVGNKFFSLAFTWLLGQQVKDTLCGTKAVWKHDYDKIARNRQCFGNFDPFGDFDLLFGASRLNLKIIDLPVRYGERTYGTTNINRWAHGWLLLRMVLFAARRIKCI